MELSPVIDTIALVATAYGVFFVPGIWMGPKIAASVGVYMWGRNRIIHDARIAARQHHG